MFVQTSNKRCIDIQLRTSYFAASNCTSYKLFLDIKQIPMRYVFYNTTQKLDRLDETSKILEKKNKSILKKIQTNFT